MSEGVVTNGYTLHSDNIRYPGSNARGLLDHSRHLVQTLQTSQKGDAGNRHLFLYDSST